MRSHSVFRNCLTFLLALVIFSCGQSQESEAVNAQNNGQISTTQTELIHEHVKSFPNKTQLSIALINNGEIKFYGIIRETDSVKSIVNESKVFEIGSISKVFTSTLLAEEIVSGSMNLSDPIQTYLDFEINTDETITLQQLANHTSGFPRLPSNLNQTIVDQNNPYKEYGSKELKNYLMNQIRLNSKPGESYAYSNLGAGLLGYLLTLQTKKSYEELLQGHIASVFNMNSTTTLRSKVEDRLVKGLNPNGSVTSNWDLNVLVGAGGILSTTEDLSKFALAQFDNSNEALGLTREKTFEANNNLNLGLGWHLIKRTSDAAWVWHNGATGGYTSSMALDIEKNKAVIILSNVSAFSNNMGNIDQLCFALMGTL